TNNHNDENDKIIDRKCIQQQYLKQISTEIDKQDQKEEQKQQQQKQVKKYNQTQIFFQKNRIKMRNQNKNFNYFYQKPNNMLAFQFHVMTQKKKVNKQNVKKRGHYLEEKSEEEQLLNEEIDENNDNVPTILQSQPKILKNEKLKDYQMIGLNWLVSLYRNWAQWYFSR
ncbi:snf2 family n-terminal domain protein, partial [Ichthyophthirius multifiliis]